MQPKATPRAPPPASSPQAPEFSPIGNELPLRWLRRLRLAPADGLGTVRRAIFFVALTWLPVMAWAALSGRLFDPLSGESLARHYGIHVRCLVAIPLFILAEATFHAGIKRIAGQFVASGVVTPDHIPAFEQTVKGVSVLRDSSLPWVFMLGVLLAWLLIDQPSANQDVLSWALAADGSLGFGGWWFAYVARPVFLALMLGWIWRLLLVSYWFWRISRLELSLLPSHPDRLGGLGFSQKLPGAYALVTFAMSSAAISRWAHEITIHGATLQSYALPAALFVAAWSLLALLPLLVLTPALEAARMRGLFTYGTLVGTQARLVHQRWILGESVPASPILDAPEIGPVADANAMYEAVANMRFVPVGRIALAKVVVPLALPMLALATLQIPLGQLLLTLAKAVL